MEINTNKTVKLAGSVFCQVQFDSKYENRRTLIVFIAGYKSDSRIGDAVWFHKYTDVIRKYGGNDAQTVQIWWKAGPDFKSAVQAIPATAASISNAILSKYSIFNQKRIILVGFSLGGAVVQLVLDRIAAAFTASAVSNGHLAFAKCEPSQSPQPESAAVIRAIYLNAVLLPTKSQMPPIKVCQINLYDSRDIVCQFGNMVVNGQRYPVIDGSIVKDIAKFVYNNKYVIGSPQYQQDQARMRESTPATAVSARFGSLAFKESLGSIHNQIYRHFIPQISIYFFA